MILDTKMRKVNHLFKINDFFSALNYIWNEGCIFSGESHDFWEMVFVVSGSVHVTEDARIYTLNTGDAILHAPMEFHTIQSAKETPTNVLIISFSTEGVMPEKLADGVFFLDSAEQNEYKELFSKIYDFYHGQASNDYLGLECTTWLSSFLIKLATNHTTERPLLRSRSAKEYHRIINTMTEKLYDNCTLEEIAKINNISVSYLKLLFKRFSGISPKIYYARLRCNEAINLLEKGFSALEVSNLLNFSSPNYFSSFFKKMTGFPPVRYCRRISEEKNGN